MSKVDWSKAPEGATAYADGVFWRYDGAYKRWRNYNGSKWILAHARKELIDCLCVEYRPDHIVDTNEKVWPDETRIDVIASNGPTGEHYEQAGTAASFLSEGMRILTERGEQYGSDKRECSFPQVAQAFNAITGKAMTGSDVCLILALVKQVRQYAQPERFHEDSAVDGVNYLALQAEQLKRERSKPT